MENNEKGYKQHSQRNRITIIRQNWAIIVFLLTLGVYVVRKFDLTFDTVEQKQRIINRYDHPILTLEEKQALRQLVNDPDRHTDYQSKQNIIRFDERQQQVLENQKKLGQDLQTLKNLLIERNERR